MKKSVYRIKWKVSEYRKDNRTGVLNPVSRSKYAEELFRKGAGFHGTERHRKRDQ